MRPGIVRFVRRKKTQSEQKNTEKKDREKGACGTDGYRGMAVEYFSPAGSDFCQRNRGVQWHGGTIFERKEPEPACGGANLFYLVENKDADFPFAFLATYATCGEEGNIRHVPLQYALTEYKGEREKTARAAVLSQSSRGGFRFNQGVCGKGRTVSSVAPDGQGSVCLFKAGGTRR